DMTSEERMVYATADNRDRYRIAATADAKFAAVKDIIDKHANQQILIIGGYVEQLEDIAKRLEVPLIHGKTSNAQREKLFEAFRTGSVQVVAVSKVANMSSDLPEAAVAIQLSGTFGSRQGEAQRRGGLLRPKSDGGEAKFYTLVTRDSIDTTYALHRQRFLAEQGYAYRLLDATDL